MTELRKQFEVLPEIESLFNNQEYNSILSIFDYIDGVLYWAEIPRDYFNSNVAYGTFNGKLRGKPAGKKEKRGYVRVKVKGKMYSAHRIIFYKFNGYLPDSIDHIDRNTGNNKIDNLRAASNSNNIANSNLRVDNTSGFKGVGFVKATGKWRATVKKNGKYVYCKYFTDKDEAIKARAMEFSKHFGEFANNASM